MEKFNIKCNDTKVVDFLANVYFGEPRNIVEAASDRAYLDLCRTLRNANGKSFSKISKGTKSKMKTAIAETIGNHVTDMPCFDQDSFDKWHEDTCNTIIEVFEQTIDNGWELSYGQAQKWLNMTLKYLYMLSYDFSETQLSRFHAVIDNYILDEANRIGVSKPPTSWSRWDHDEYVKYQKELRERVKESLFAWEFKAWNEKESRRGEDEE